MNKQEYNDVKHNYTIYQTLYLATLCKMYNEERTYMELYGNLRLIEKNYEKYLKTKKHPLKGESSLQFRFHEINSYIYSYAEGMFQDTIGQNFITFICILYNIFSYKALGLHPKAFMKEYNFSMNLLKRYLEEDITSIVEKDMRERIAMLGELTDGGEQYE